MAKTTRIIKFTYESTTTSAEIDMARHEIIDRQEKRVIREAVDGTRYQVVTGSKRNFIYSFEYMNETLFDFFNDAYTSFNGGNSVTFQKEQDDGTFESISVLVLSPQYQDESLGTTDKAYRDFSIEILEI